MTTLNEYEPGRLVKMLLLGEPGTGKTGSTASLVKAGYNLRVIDLDFKLRSLMHQLTPEERAKVEVISIKDKMKLVQAQPMPAGPPTAALEIARLMTHWRHDGVDLGRTDDWTDKEVLFLDGATEHGIALVHFAMSLNKFDKPRRAEPWEIGSAQGMMTALYSEACKSLPCHFIVSAHIKLAGGDQGMDLRGKDEKAAAAKADEASRDAKGVLMPLRGYPITVGKALSLEFARHFDYVLELTKEPYGSKAKRYISNTTNLFLPTKQPVPGLPNRWPLEEGLANFFEAVRKAA